VSGEAVLIAGYSGRALAQSAQRAGYVPLVADGYADADTRDAAETFVHLPEFVTTGVTRTGLQAALDQLSASCARPPIGLVLGAGFEDRLLLAAALEDDFPVLGTSAASATTCKTPAQFFPTLTRLGIAHPETRFDPPLSPEGWLTKKIGGSGGRHIRETHAGDGTSKHAYFQKKISGAPLSVLGIVSPAGDAFAFSRQWTSPVPSQPFRYGGATGPLTLDEDLEARLIDTCLTLAREFDLIGLVSFDFLVENSEAMLIEINPRPGATLDVFDDASGTLFAAHVAACTGENPAELLQEHWQPPAARSAAYLYADRGALTVNTSEWPGWVMDRPMPGTRIAAGNPIATVSAEASTPDAAERLCFERMGLLQTMLYDNAQS
jgi:uncharacterized protein